MKRTTALVLAVTAFAVAGGLAYRWNGNRDRIARLELETVVAGSGAAALFQQQRSLINQQPFLLAGAGAMVLVGAFGIARSLKAA